MDFELDDDHRMLQEQIRDFATNEVAKGAAEAMAMVAERPMMAGPVIVG